MDDTPKVPPSESAQALTLLTEIRDLIKKQDRPLLTAAEVCEWLGQSLRSMSRSESAGTFPAGLETPSGARWRREDVLKWVKELKPRTKKGRRFPIKIRRISPG